MTQAASQLPQHESENDIVLSLDAFVRSVGIRRAAPLSVFVGAGASIQFRPAVGADVYLGVEAQHFPHQQPWP